MVSAAAAAAEDLLGVTDSLLLLWVVESALELELAAELSVLSVACLLVLSAEAEVSLVVTVDAVVVVGPAASRVIVLVTRVPSGFSVITTTISLPDWDWA